MRTRYWPTAAFLLYLEQTHDRAIVPKLHRAIASGTYREDLFKDLTGKPVEALWQDFVAKEKATREPPRPSS